MVSPTGMRVEGLNETIRNLQKLGAGVEELKGAMSNIASKAAGDAQANAPVGETGKLSASVKGNKAKAKAIIKAGTKKTYYASFNEWGTSTMTGTGFMTSAVEANAGYAANQIESELTRIIRRLDLN